MIFSHPALPAPSRPSSLISRTDRWQVLRMAEYWAVRSITSSRPSIGLPASSNTSMPTSSDFATVLACLS